MITKKSKNLFHISKQIIPHGVNSPVRYFDPYPIFIKKSNRSYIWDEDDNKYIDFCNCYGAMLLGHKHNKITLAVTNQIKNGTLFCAPTKLEITLSKLIQRNFPSMRKIRLVNTGTEAAMTAIRLVKGYTKKKKIIKFHGGYHGSYDAVLTGSGSGFVNIRSQHRGFDRSSDTIVIQYNNIDELENVVKKNDDIAGLIMEPVLANMGVILPQKNYLKKVRLLTRDHDIPLIFDEIVTGFRLSEGGAQKIFGITPDITILGKILGNGFVIGAIGGKNKILEHLSPVGKVYQASTFAGNPISVTAAIHSIQTINELKNKLYDKLQNYCDKLTSAIDDIATDFKIPHVINHVASMYQIFFTDIPVIDYTTCKTSNTTKFKKLFSSLLKNGIFIPPSQFESVFASYAHTKNDINKTISAYYDALKCIEN
ncbi:MAG: glutamate-1-semialdehyde 2,1-aminomutase [Thaumarchaeota archaeon]|nr:glutamate-1-semialdehyde 2,1-aminomutase [Nitrososphaerota archaeon]